MLQDLYPHLPALRPARWCTAAWGVLCALVLSTCSPSLHASGRDDVRLLQQVQQWVAQQEGWAPDMVKPQAIDKRIQVPHCLDGWTLDAPFPAQASVRAQCDSPKAQLFVQWTSPQARLSLPVTVERPQAAELASKPALAVSRTLPRGTHLDDGMVQWVDVPANQWSNHHLGDMAVIRGSELMRDMVPGQLIRRQDIRPSVLVKKGQMVSFQVGQSANFMITASLLALQDGRMGEQIRLKNPDSGRILSGVVMGLNAVRTP